MDGGTGVFAASSIPPIVATILLAALCSVESELAVYIYNAQNPLHRVAMDSSIHFAIGCLCWVTFRGFNTDHLLLEILLCGLFSSVIDIDHIVEARSLHIRDWMSLHHRSFLHTTLSIPVACLVIWIISRGIWWTACRYSSLEWVKQYKKTIAVTPAILVVAWSSHQLRDGTRRGLSFAVMGQTGPVPVWLYATLMCAIPNCARIFVALLSVNKPVAWMANEHLSAPV